MRAERLRTVAAVLALAVLAVPRGAASAPAEPGLPGPSPEGGVPAPASAPPSLPVPRPARPVRQEGPPEFTEPMTEAMERLGLTDLQRRVLCEVFREYDHERPAPSADAPLIVQVAPTVPDGLYRLGPGGDLPVRLQVAVQVRGGVGAVALRYLVQDFYGRKVAGGRLPRLFPDATGRARTDLVLREADAFGYYHVLVTATAGGRSATGACGFLVVYPPSEGPSPESLFGLVLGPGADLARALESARRLGARSLAVDWNGSAEVVETVRKAGLVPVPVVALPAAGGGGGSAAGGGGPAGGGPPTTPAAGPARGPAAGEAREALAALLPMLEAGSVLHLGREPALDGADLAGAVAAHRRAVRDRLTALRRAETPALLMVGTTPAVLANVLTEGPVLAGADGVVLWTSAGAEAPTLRSGAYLRSVDYGVQVARRLGLGRVEVATDLAEPGAASPQARAWKLVARQMLALEAGARRVYFAPGERLPTLGPPAAAYAWMTHLLADARYEGDAWAEVPCLEAHLFALPPGGTVGAAAPAARSAAVVWSWVGHDDGPCDRGVLVLEDGLGVEATDVVGQPVGIWKGRRLLVPLSEAPIYLLSADLSAAALRDRLRRAQVVGVAPGTVRIESIIRGRVPGRVRVTLWVQSHRPDGLAGRAGLLVPDGWKPVETKKDFSLAPGEAKEVTFECEAPETAGPGPFPMEAVVSLDEEFVRRRQKVWVAQTPRRTIEVGYGLADWDGIRPVVVESADRRTWAEVRTAWDADHFYVAVSVRRKRATFRAGRFPFEGDAVQLAWGVKARADDDFGHPARGWALPEGAFRDTDHLMALVFGRKGPQVLRLGGPRIALRVHMPGNLDPWFGPVEGAQVDIARDGAVGHTIFEAAVPWKQLAPLRGGEGRIYRFGFLVGDGDGPPLSWPRAAGVPVFLTNPCSFLPQWRPRRAPQTWWGMVGEVSPERR